MFPDEDYEEKEIQLQSGDRLFLYTDGIIECRNQNDEEFGLDRLINYIKSHHNLDIDSLLENIFSEVNTFTGKKEICDDQTLVILEIE